MSPIGSLKSNERQESKPRHGKSFGDNLDTLFHEIILAAQWGRPSLLLAVHKSTFGIQKAEQALETRLKEEGMEVARIVVNDQRFDTAELILQGGTRPVYFVSNLDWAGGAEGTRAYHALNLKRELFVENRIRVVFWLTSAEAAHLARHAPDFWAFRHRVVEFASPRGKTGIQLPAGVLLWDQQTVLEIFDGPEAAIRAREELLEKLPTNPESLSARVELHYSIAFLRWALGDSAGASAAFRAGLELVGRLDLAELKSRLLNGRGILSYEAGDFKEALAQFGQGMELSPSGASLRVNYAAAASMLGRKQAAIDAGRKLLGSKLVHPESLQRLGYVLAAVGQVDEAIHTVEKAIEAAPTAWRFRVTLAVLYTIVDRLDETRKQLDEARATAGSGGTWYVDIIQAAANQEADETHKRLRDAIRAGGLTQADVRRDPNLAILLEEDQLAEFAA